MRYRNPPARVREQCLSARTVLLTFAKFSCVRGAPAFSAHLLRNMVPAHRGPIGRLDGRLNPGWLIPVSGCATRCRTTKERGGRRRHVRLRSSNGIRPTWDFDEDDLSYCCPDATCTRQLGPYTPGRPGEPRLPVRHPTSSVAATMRPVLPHGQLARSAVGSDSDTLLGRTTITGQWACCTHCRPTDPRSMLAKPPRPR